jgi:hypothetical protein
MDTVGRSRYQFSLATLLVGITIICTLLALWQAHPEIAIWSHVPLAAYLAARRNGRLSPAICRGMCACALVWGMFAGVACAFISIPPQEAPAPTLSESAWFILTVAFVATICGGIVGAAMGVSMWLIHRARTALAMHFAACAKRDPQHVSVN